MNEPTITVLIRFTDGRKHYVSGVTSYCIDYRNNELLVITVTNREGKERKLFFNMRQVECVGDAAFFKELYTTY